MIKSSDIFLMVPVASLQCVGSMCVCVCGVAGILFVSNRQWQQVAGLASDSHITSAAEHLKNS